MKTTIKTSTGICIVPLLFVLMLAFTINDAQAQIVNFKKLINLKSAAHTPAMDPTNDGGSVNTGWHFPATINGQPNAGSRVYLQKLNGNYQAQWTRRYVAAYEINNNDFTRVQMEAHDVKQLSNGQYIVSGRIFQKDTANVVTERAFLMRTTPGGGVIWFKRYFFEGLLNSVIQVDSGFVACGYRVVPGVGEETRVLKTDGSGNLVWYHTITNGAGQPELSRYREVIRYSSYQYALVGDWKILSTTCGQQRSDVLVTIINDFAAAPVFTSYAFGRTLAPDSSRVSEFGNTITRDGQGFLIIAGHTVYNNPATCQNDAQDVLLFKIDLAGNVIFAREFDIRDKDIPRDVIINGNFNQIAIAGNADNESFLLLTSPNGVFQNLTLQQYVGPTTATQLYENSANRYVLIGNTNPGLQPYDDIFLTEWNPAWDSICYDLYWQPVIRNVQLPRYNLNTDSLFKIEDPLQVVARAMQVIDSVLCDTVPALAVCPIDIFEPNDFIVVAKHVVPLFSTKKHARLCSAYDEDWFSFDVSGYKRNVRVRLSDLPKDYNIEMWNDTMMLTSPLAVSENPGTMNEQIAMNNMPKGRYYVRVYGSGGAWSPKFYNLMINLGAKAPGGVIVKPSIHAPAGASGTLRTGAAPVEATMLAYPNPVIDILKLEVSAPSGTGSSLEIRDMYGRAVAQKTWDLEAGVNSMEVPVSRLSPGTYVVTVRSGNWSISDKIVVIR